MKLTFLRHAQSIYNKYLTSGPDCDLSPEGVQQARALTGDYDVVVVSTLRRTHQTLLYSQITAKRILMTDLCREKRNEICDFLEGEDPTRLESDAELALRAECFLEWLRRYCQPTERILVISHGDFIRHFLPVMNYPQNATPYEWPPNPRI